MPPRYKPLDPTGQHIRLLNILPSKDNSTPLSCTLTYTTLGAQNELYEALSYTWGYPEPNKIIILDGEAIKIIESLEAALRRLRQSNKVRTFWIDAICINQADQDEKASQIYLMDSIYRNATQVVIWLGEPDDGNRSAMMSLAVKNFSLTNSIQIWRTQRKHSVRRGWRAVNTAILTGEMDCANGHFEAEVGLVAQLLDRPWWRRVWIVQEVILAKKTIVMCGPDEVPWDNIKTRLGVHLYGLKSNRGVHWSLRTHNGSVIDSRYKWPDIEHELLDTMQDAWRSGEWKLNFYDLIYQFRRLSCSLPQDRIFAYLGLVSADQSAGIRVDYKTPIAQLYFIVAKSLIAAHKHLLVLNCKREFYGSGVQYQETRLYSTLDQGRFVDPQATVINQVTSKLRKGWIRLPEGWERTVDDDGTWFHDRSSGIKQRDSPLQGRTFPPQTSEDFRHVPTGWRKEWDSLGRVKYTYSQYQAANNNVIELPSWVPNWNTYSIRDPEPLPVLSDADSCYWASGRNRQVTFTPTSYSDSNALGLKGMLFDTIKVIAVPWHPEAEKMPISRSGVEILQEWEKLALSRPDDCPYKSTKGRVNAFWRTHIADYAGENSLPEQDKTFFDAWCDRTGWTPKPANLKHKNLSSLMNYARPPHEKRALDEMYLHIYAGSIDPEVDSTLRSVPKGILNSIKDSFARRNHVQQRYKEVRSRIYRASANRAMFVTSKGFIGLGPWNARKGDSIVILLGGCTPFLLRPVNNVFTLVGEAYVYGIMGGELFGHEIGHARLRDFEII